MKFELNKISKEMILNFRMQYPERYEKYEVFFQEDICFRSQRAIQRAILTYCDLIEDMSFIIELIRIVELIKDIEKK